jgi:PKD repeat protein
MARPQRTGSGRMTVVVMMVLSLLMAPMPSIVISSGPSDMASMAVDVHAPPVQRPEGVGPHTVAKTYDIVTLSDKGTTVRVRADYPAESELENATPDMSGAPYPVIFFGPGAGCNENSYGGLARDTAGWGFVFITIGFDWGLSGSGNVADFRDVVDHYIGANGSSGHKLYQMLDGDRYSSGGHSHGARVAARSTPYIPEFRIYMGLSPSITQGEVDAIADDFHIPMQLHTGTDDPVPGHRYLYNTIDTVKETVTAIGAGHSGQFDWAAAVAFLFYHLSGDDRYEYWTYKAGIMQAIADGNITLRYDRQDGRFFPPALTATASKTSVVEDEGLSLNVTLDGYYDPGFGDEQFHWDIHGDGDKDWQGADPPNISVSYDRGPSFKPSVHYSLGAVAIVDSVVPQTVYVNNLIPVAEVSMSGSELNEDQMLELNATGSDDTPSDLVKLLYRFDFGDGTVRAWDTDPLANHSYPKAKVYDLEVTVKDDDGMTDAWTAQAHVSNVAPTVAPLDDIFVWEDEPVGLTAIGNDTPSDVPGLRYMWDMGDGHLTDWSSNGSIEHSYGARGNYTVTASVMDNDDEMGSTDFTVRVGNAVPSVSILMPAPSWTFKEDEEVVFSGEVMDNASDIPFLECSWDHGDGTASDWSPSPSDMYAYPRAGTYDVVLMARDDDGVIGTSNVTIHVENVAPRAEIDDSDLKASLEEDEAMDLKGLVEDTPSDLEAINCTWRVEGLGVAAYGMNASLSFERAGFYRISLVVRDDDGSEASDTVTVTVSNVNPRIMDADVRPSTVFVGEKVDFWSNVSDTPSDIGALVCSWDMDDGTVYTNASGAHTYSSAGTYKVTFTVTDDDPFSNVHRFFTVEVKEKEVPPPPPPPPPQDGPDGVSVLVLGGIIGAIAAVLATMLALLLMMRRRERARPSTERIEDDEVGGTRATTRQKDEEE